MFIGTDHQSILRSVRSETRLQPASEPSCCAPEERGTKSVTSGYKHLAPLGRNHTITRRQRQEVQSSTFRLWFRDARKLKLELLNSKLRASHSPNACHLLPKEFADSRKCI